MNERRFRLNGNVTSRDVQMLDTTLQGLFALGLKLEYCIALVDESPEQAKDGIDTVLSALTELMEPIRDRIMELG